MHFHIFLASKEGDASMVTGQLHTQAKCPTKPSTKHVLLLDHVPNFNTHFPLFAYPVSVLTGLDCGKPHNSQMETIEAKKSVDKVFGAIRV